MRTGTCLELPNRGNQRRKQLSVKVAPFLVVAIFLEQMLSEEITAGFGACLLAFDVDIRVVGTNHEHG